MSDKPNLMTHERIMSGEKYVSYSDYLLLKEKYDTLVVENMLEVNKLCKERDEAREALREMWRSGDAFLPYVDAETINRWRKAAGWGAK